MGTGNGSRHELIHECATICSGRLNNHITILRVLKELDFRPQSYRVVDCFKNGGWDSSAAEKGAESDETGFEVGSKAVIQLPPSQEDLYDGYDNELLP